MTLRQLVTSQQQTADAGVLVAANVIASAICGACTVPFVLLWPRIA